MKYQKLWEVEKQYIIQVLKAKKGNRVHTARTLGIGIRTLQMKLKRWGLADYGLEKKEEKE